MKIKELIRFLVMETNTWPAFSILNKIPYYLAVRIFVRKCRNFPEIKSIYLRQSFADGNWVPGLSDIDWSIVINDNLTPRQELAFLNNFWNGYNLVKKIFPMVGEVEIVKKDDLDNLISFGVKNYNFFHWKLIYGIKFKRPVCNSNNGDNILYHALVLYYEYFLKKFFSYETHNSLLKKELDRIFEKIFQFLNQGSSSHKQFQRSKTIFDSLCHTFKIIEKVDIDDIDSIKYNSRWSKYTISVEKNELIESPFDGCLKNLPLLTEELIKNCQGGIKSLIMVRMGHRLLIILKNNLQGTELRNILKKIRCAVLKFSICCNYILSERMLEHFIHIYHPISFYSQRQILFGDDMIKEIKYPNEDSLLRFAIRESLFFPLRLRKLTPAKSDYLLRLLSTDMDYLFEEVMLIKLLLEKGILVTSYCALLEEWEKNYCKSYHALKSINKEAAANDILFLNNQQGHCLTQTTDAGVYKLAEMKFSLIGGLIKDLTKITTNYFEESKFASNKLMYK